MIVKPITEDRIHTIKEVVGYAASLTVPEAREFMQWYQNGEWSRNPELLGTMPQFMVTLAKEIYKGEHG